MQRDIQAVVLGCTDGCRHNLHVADQQAVIQLALGPKDVNQRFKARFKMDNVDDQIDTVTRSTMALTVSCARCHDHKFDPIPTRDYYSLASIFSSTDDAAGLAARWAEQACNIMSRKILRT